MNRNKLAMVDLDGTLIFTGRANYAAYRQALAEAGFALAEETFQTRCEGRSYRDFLPEIMGTDHPLIEQVHDRKIALYPGCLTQAEPNRLLLDILEGLRPQYLLALVTTASRANVRAVLAHFGLSDFFDCVVTQEDVSRAKPDPACYLELMERLQIPAENCVIFEDSASGVAAALASGCQTLCVRRGAEP